MSDDIFERRVRSAAVAGWWVVLAAAALLTVVWFVYLAIVSTRPPWLESLWGPGFSWDFMQNVSIWFVSVFKLCIWLMALFALWLTLWARQLRKVGS